MMVTGVASALAGYVFGAMFGMPGWGAAGAGMVLLVPRLRLLIPPRSDSRAQPLAA